MKNGLKRKRRSKNVSIIVRLSPSVVEMLDKVCDMEMYCNTSRSALIELAIIEKWKRFVDDLESLESVIKKDD